MTNQMETRAGANGAGSLTYASEAECSPPIIPAGGCYEHLPSELTNRARWVPWRLVEGDKRPLVKWGDPACWTSFDAARAQAPHDGGVGIVFDGDGLGGIDLDACRDPETGELTDWAREIIEDFSSYTEISPSGTGVKIFALGAMPELPANTIAMPGEPVGKKRPQIEAYTNGRFFTVTGKRLPDAPQEVRVAAEAWLRLHTRLKEVVKSAAGASKPAAGRNDYLYKKACSLVAQNYPEAAIRAALKQMNADADERMHPNFAAGPLCASELEQVIRSALKRPSGKEMAHREFDLSDIGNGKRLVARHGDDMRYCHLWRSWLIYDGKRFRKDEAGEAVRHAKETAVAIYEEATAVAAGDPERAKAVAKHAGASQQRARIEAMLWAAQSEPGITIMPGNLDRDSDLLNLENGTLDLQTLTLREHRREDNLTKLAPVALEANAKCPTWEAFLDRIFCGDEELIAFMQRTLGYTLTGEVKEHVFFLLHGSGANGKTTLVKTIAAMLGDYAEGVRVESLLASDRNKTGANEDVAGLFGVRFAETSEPDDQFRLNESLIKRLTGGDTIKARRLYEQLFEFQPTHKLFLAANHKPEIRGVDEGIWRRVMFIPFEVTIPKEERDPDLPKKLREELPGILRWCVEGLRAYRAEGLNPPEKVRAATEKYREEQDILADFLTVECEIEAGAYAVTSLLTDAYNDFTGQEAVKAQTFAKLLKARGFRSGVKKINGKAVRVWTGLRLRPHPYDERNPPPPGQDAIPF